MFHKGQSVICIDDSEFGVTGYGFEEMPVAGRTYTVRDVTAVRGTPAIRVEEIRNDVLAYKDGPHQTPYDWEQAFAAWRFRPLVEGEHKREVEEVV